MKVYSERAGQCEGTVNQRTLDKGRTPAWKGDPRCGNRTKPDTEGRFFCWRHSGQKPRKEKKP